MMSFSIDFEKFIIQFHSRDMSDPSFSDKNKMAWVWTTLKFLKAKLVLTGSN